MTFAASSLQQVNGVKSRGMLHHSIHICGIVRLCFSGEIPLYYLRYLAFMFLSRYGTGIAHIADRREKSRQTDPGIRVMKTPLARISHQASSRNTGDACGCKEHDGRATRRSGHYVKETD